MEYLGAKYDDYKLWAEDVWDCWVKHKLKSIKRKNLNRRKKVKTDDSSATPPTKTTPSDDEHMDGHCAESTNEHNNPSDAPRVIDNDITITSIPPAGCIINSPTPLFGRPIATLDTIIPPSSPMYVDPPIPPPLTPQTCRSESVSSQSPKQRKCIVKRKWFKETLMKTISQWLEAGLVNPIELRALAMNHTINRPLRSQSESLSSGQSAQEDSDANGDSDSMKEIVRTVSSAASINTPDDAPKLPPRSVSPVQSQSHHSLASGSNSPFKSSTPLTKEPANKFAMNPKLKPRQTQVQTPRPSNKSIEKKDDDESEYHPSHSEDGERSVDDSSESGDSSNGVKPSRIKSTQVPSSTQPRRQTSSSGWCMMIHTVDSDSELDETVGSTKVNKSRLNIRAIPPDDLEELDTLPDIENKTSDEATAELSEDDSNSKMDVETGEKDPEEEKRKFRRRLYVLLVDLANNILKARSYASGSRNGADGSQREVGTRI